jgi:hypothetical protein
MLFSIQSYTAVQYNHLGYMFWRDISHHQTFLSKTSSGHFFLKPPVDFFL